MVNIDDHLNLNRILLIAIGLWPYQKSKLARLQSIYCYSMLITIIVFQLTTFVTSKCTIDLVIQVFSATSAVTGATIMYNWFYINSETIKYSTEQLQRICNDLKDKNEIAIIERYGSHVKRFTVVTISAFVCVSSFVMGYQLWPIFHDILLSTKVSRPRSLMLKTEYFVDQEKYFYLPLLHINISFFIAFFTSVAVGTTIIAYYLYVSAMFHIASYRIEHAMQICTVQSIILLNEKMIYKRIVCAVDIHRKAMMFSDRLISRFQLTSMILIIFGVMDLSLNFYRTLETISLGCKDFLVPFLIASISLIYLFLANFVAQQIIDDNNHIFATAYNIRWVFTVFCYA
ncbi:uncharacterized protein [Linepithema humile]|uniref:uncharacterized protein isoform X2 n=1 Tax=Linepithema humile TaxID=83485 RepID=UPI00351E3F56